MQAQKTWERQAYFGKESQRNAGIFARIVAYDAELPAFLGQYWTEARSTGLVISEKIPNPSEQQLSYYEEMLGREYHVNLGFFLQSLQRWLPRVGELPRRILAESIYDCLDALAKQGNSEAMCRNAYIKWMCWFYYRLERVVQALGKEPRPKLLYEGEISKYELQLLHIVHRAGCDVLLLQTAGDSAYQRLDPQNQYSQPLLNTQPQPFPQGFSLQSLQAEQAKIARFQAVCGRDAGRARLYNSWMIDTVQESVCTPPALRSRDVETDELCFVRLRGVEDTLSYKSDLYQFQRKCEQTGRALLCLEGALPRPSTEEIAQIRRASYQNLEDLLLDLSKNIQFPRNLALERLMKREFIAIIREESEKTGKNLNKLTNLSVYLLCWLKRYQSPLFASWQAGNLGIVLFLGAVKQESEAQFLRLLSRLPLDVVLLQPDLQEHCLVQDENLLEQTQPLSLSVCQFPKEEHGGQLGTVAYQAEQELTGLLYQDTGLYRPQQYQSAEALSLQTMYEEIALLWAEDVSMRPHFAVVDERVNLPVLYAKVCGVKDGNVNQYWADLRKLMTPETFLIAHVPFLHPTDENPIKPAVTQFWKQGRLQKQAILTNPNYSYGFLRQEIQELLLEKLDLLLEQKNIRGFFTKGTEYTALAVALHLPKEILRLLQNFDFTKRNPKVIVILNTEQSLSVEDTILLDYLHLLGFDVVCFVPTGYQTIETHWTPRHMETHQIGVYLYDLPIPNLTQKSTSPSWRDLFKRGS